MFRKSEKMTGAGALLSAALIYATFGILIRESSEMFGNGAQIAIRFAAAAFLILIFKLILQKTLTLSRQQTVKTLSLGVVFALIVIFFTIAVNETKIANSVFLLYAGSIISSLIVGTMFLKESLSKAKILAIIVAVCGLAMFADNFLVLSIGVVAGFVSGLFDGVGNAIRKSLKGADRNLVVMYSYAIGAAVALIMALGSGEQMVSQFSWSAIITMAIFVGLMIGISNLLLYGFQHFDVNVGTIILSCELVFATILGYLFFREIPSVPELVGGALVFSASALTVLDSSTRWRQLFAKRERSLK